MIMRSSLNNAGCHAPAGRARSSWRRRAVALTLIPAIALTVALSLWPVGLAAQSQKNKKNKQDSQTVEPQAPMPDPQAIDLVISEMLGYWQIGDVDMMHKYYADDVTIISGAFEQPLFGWA